MIRTALALAALLAAGARAAEDHGVRAAEFYAQRCALCHGAEGRGDGAGAAGLEADPRDFTSREWQDGIDDGAIRRIVLEGGAAVGKSPQMPPTPDLEDDPDLLAALVAYLRGFAPTEISGD